jgi:Divergent InlB B-repeat domain
VNSTAGGFVTKPGEGINENNNEGSVVDLLAVPNSGFEFVNWTGNTTTIASANSSATTITISDNYSITANFQAGNSTSGGYEAS